MRCNALQPAANRVAKVVGAGAEPANVVEAVHADNRNIFTRDLPIFTKLRRRVDVA